MSDNLKKWLPNIVLMLAGIGLAIGIGVLIAPGLLSDDRLRNADTVMTAQYTVGDGDIFANQYGTIRPPENPDEILSEHQLAWDADGFRLPAQSGETYDIVALGDSFTEATNVARPWSDVLAETSGLAVRNLGFRGYGTQQYAQVMERYGMAASADVVIVGFFGGNDVFSAGIENDDFILPALAENLENIFADDDPWRVDGVDDFQYPMFINSGETPQPIAFLNGYLAWMNIEEAALRDSSNYERIVQHLTSISNSADENTCLILAYFPPKVEVYMPYLRD
ncbi:MAG: SGNH/GDSL hydrolase family protein, partial [Aggregatilineales bacterium]